MILPLRLPPDAVQPKPAPAMLFPRHLQAGLPSDALHPLVVRIPAVVPQQTRSSQRLVAPDPRCAPLHRPMLPPLRLAPPTCAAAPSGTPGATNIVNFREGCTDESDPVFTSGQSRRPGILLAKQ